MMNTPLKHWTRLRCVAGTTLAALLALQTARGLGQDAPDGTARLRQTTFAAGGGRSAGAAFVLSSSIGQPFAGAASAGPHLLAAGFWPSVLAAEKEPGSGAPALRIMALPDGRLLVAWPGATRGFRLQSALSLGARAAWADVKQTPVLSRDEWTVALARDQRVEFFRLVGAP